jgi:hypothetical protein
MSIRALILIAFIPFISTGNTFCGAGSNNNGVGATAWSFPGNITADDNAVASCNAGASSWYLFANGFNFSLPQNAKILGFTVRIGASESSTGAENLNAQILNSSAAVTGSSKSVSINGTGETIYTYGSSTDVWGTSLNTNDINTSNFGVAFWFTTSHNLSIDWVTMSIDYSLGGGFFRAQSSY